MAYDRLVMLDDIGKVFTFKAGRIISGGFLVGFSSGTDIVSSGGNFGGLAFSDIIVDAGSVGPFNFIGIALTTGSNGAAIAVATQGVFVLQAATAGVTGGKNVTVTGTGSNFITAAAGSDHAIGRAYSTATLDTGFAVVRLY
jgi:predicted RecA/RadA family phage recombinase